MKKALLALLSAIFPLVVFGAPTLNQTPALVGSSLPSQAYAGSVVSGSLMIDYLEGSGCGSATVSDTVNGSHALAVNNDPLCVWYKVATTTGTPTVSVAGTGGSFINLTLAQFIGWSGTPTLDSCSTATALFAAASATLTGSPITSCHANEIFVISSAYTGTFSLGGASGWTSLGGASDYTQGRAGYAIQATSGTSNNFSSALNASVSWQLQAVGFYDAGGSSCPHNGWSITGAWATPNGSSGSYWSLTGAWVTPNCSSINYYQQSGAAGAN